MSLTYRAFAPISVVVFGLLALSGSESGVSFGAGVAFLVLGLVTPVLLFVCALRWPGAAATRREAQRRALADSNDLMRMDSDKG